MKKVLLAITGETPDQRIFDYAVQLCLRIKARLNILQIAGPGALKGSAGRLRKQAERFRRIVDDQMMAVTFAEAGEAHPFRPPKGTEPVFDDLTVGTGPAAREIIDYIDARRDIVLALYDPKLEAASGPSLPDRVKDAVEIPLVRVGA